jgi:outer membrane protein assembly factor BamA
VKKRVSVPVLGTMVVVSAATLVAGRAGWAEGEGADAPNASAHPGKRVELGLVPLVGGDTDVGLGVGLLSTIAGVAPKVQPYRWAVESAGFISFKSSGGSLIIPYQDYSVQWTAPQLLNGRLRLELRPSFTKETTQRYYGLGNASPAPTADVPARDYYGRTHPTVWLRMRYRIWDHLSAGLGSSYTENWLKVNDASTLGQQMETGTPEQRELLGRAARHGVVLLEAIGLWDSRDNETVSERGQAYQARLRVSPSPSFAADALPYAYEQLNLSARVYWSLVPDRLVIGVRLVGDFQFGHPPFYELARYDDTFALGGQNGVRGVPGQRYYGKIKTFGNLEVRSQLFRFKLFGKDMTLGAAVFFDAGRAWADWSRQPALDGSGWGLKYGTGGGLRLQQGKTFVVRADLAWSPDARPVGAYVGAGQMF